MNSKGFAITTMVYALVLLMAMSMFIVLEIMENNYTDNKNIINEIQGELDKCLIDETC